MPKGIQIALFLNGLGLLATIPCLLETTPLSMTAFFMLGIPLFAAGFLLYVVAVIRDLRQNNVL
jgi:hypothetical protein